MGWRALASAAVAASILAASLCVLALYLNPDLRLVPEIPALLVCLFLPWALAGSLVLALVAVARLALRRSPARAVIPGWPHLGSLTFVALGVAAVLYWHNLFSYRHSIPVDALSALALSAVVISGMAQLRPGMKVRRWER